MPQDNVQPGQAGLRDGISPPQQHQPINPSRLTAIKSTNAETIDLVIKASITAVRAVPEAAEGKEAATITPLITMHADAIDAADCQNQLYQAVIGAKEGMTEDFVLKCGPEITNAVLHNPDGDYKGINDCELHQLVTACLQAAAHPFRPCPTP